LSTTAASLSGTLAVTGAVTAGNNTNVQATSTNTRLLVTAAGVANTVLGFNNSGSTENGVVNNAGYIGILQDYPLVVTIADGEKMRITGAGNVGIGTSTPSRKLTIYDTDVNIPTLGFRTDGSGTSALAGFDLQYASNNVFAFNRQNGYIAFGTNDTERFRITNNGVTFNGDPAAANALDDYEEGTWTPSVAFGGASVGVVLSVANGATYTKIGRQVTVNGFFAITSKGSSTGAATITGLPFTIGNGAQFYAAASLFTESISFVNVLQGRGDNNTTTIQLFEVTVLGALTTITNADFSDTSNINLSLTYFV
jgi:hypothetical protein